MRAFSLFLLLLAGCYHDPYAHLYSAAKQAKPHEPLLIVPRLSMGRVKSGMTVKDVIDAIGKPDRSSPSGHNLEYLRFGFSVVANHQGMVSVVMCGDACDKTSPLIKMFAGRTKEGIGMGSSRSELIAAFGQPTVAVPWGDEGEERLIYKERGLEFVLADAKIHHIVVDMRKLKG